MQCREEPLVDLFNRTVGVDSLEPIALEIEINHWLGAGTVDIEAIADCLVSFMLWFVWYDLWGDLHQLCL